jgi:hypothetical protein
MLARDFDYEEGRGVGLRLRIRVFKGSGQDSIRSDSVLDA